MLKEREAIEIVEGIVKSYIEADECGLSNNDFKHEIRALQTVLNMLKEKDAEIEKLEQTLARNIARNVTSSMKESAKSKEDLEMLNAGWQIELEKKDKIIYEMIDAFIDLGFGFEYCNNDDRCINDCDKCIKQYFERKATNNG